MKSGICLQNILRYRFPQGTINPKHSMERTDEIGRDCLERLLNVNIVRDSFVGGVRSVEPDRIGLRIGLTKGFSVRRQD